MRYLKEFEYFSQKFDFDFKINCYGNIEEIESQYDGDEDTCEIILDYLIDNDKIKLGHFNTFSRGNIRVDNDSIILDYEIKEGYYDDAENYTEDIIQHIKEELLLDDELKIMLSARKYNL